ncbi:MAG: FAD-dependent oxidoreductase [Chloroflexi bacterium]|nr:FAD-dependent oxidoreductase [Chloroflexota bacterium]
MATLRVAIIGSGPAAFYAAEHLLKQTGNAVQVDMFDRLPTPFGLVRGGVAPDHAKIKSVTKVYEKIAANPRFRFFGNVEFGSHIALADFRAHYHQILYATGAQTDRRMNIPGEDLRGSHPATEFVAWYNGHPDYRDCHFDLSQERVAVIGVGNVAIDVARILCRTRDELTKTDIADHALEALCASRVKEVYLIGRRGPVQAAFTAPEIKEVGEMQDADVFARADEVALDPLSRAELEKENDLANVRKVETIQAYAARQPSGKSRKLFLRFLMSPVELFGDASGRVTKMRLVRNTLVASESGALSAQATDQFEELEVGLVFRSVGYRGVALPDVPFHDKWGVILNEKGRVLDPESKQSRVGEYVAGWIKRGPSGVIGTNKPDSVETANAMLEDAQRDATMQPAHADPLSAENLIRARQPRFVSFADWQTLDRLELQRGAAQGRPRVKFTRVEAMLRAVGK